MNKFTESLGKEIFGVSPKESIAKHRCIGCWTFVDLGAMSPVDAKEFSISGLCPVCWDKMFEEPKED